MKSFLHIEQDSDFPLDNIPFGVFHLKSEPETNARCATRIGDFVIDLGYLEEHKYLNTNTGDKEPVFAQKNLNSFMALPKITWSSVRKQLQELFSIGSILSTLSCEETSTFIFAIALIHMLLPCRIGDYTDFYSSKNHAYNVGVMFRGPENALQPNWLWLPVGYHGRASSIVPSPATFVRPSGQIKGPSDQVPRLAKSGKMDFELELGVFLGKSNKLGEPISIDQAEDFIFGYVLLNDISMRDVQNWEYVPLGPFTAKNCITVISPWIVTHEALLPFRTKIPPQDPAPLEYLNDKNYSGFDVTLDIFIKVDNNSNEQKISSSNMKYLYWTFPQQITHHSVSGCNMNVGDLLGSGTISGTEKNEFGSFLELSWNGKEPLALENNQQRSFWQDNDEIVIRGHARKGELRIGFGECSTKMFP
jgi:fumarylacetoacetase